MKKRIISAIMVICILTGIFTFSTFATETKQILNVKITMDEHAVGDSVFATAARVSLPDYPDVQVGAGAVWHYWSGGYEDYLSKQTGEWIAIEDSSYVFENGGVYRYFIVLEAPSGYVFPYDSAKKQDGYFGNVTVVDFGGEQKSNTVGINNNQNMLGVLYTFIIRPSDETPEEGNPFTDVKRNAYYHDAVLWALENNITKGTSKTTFSPQATCTRGQVVTFLWRAMGCPEPKTTENPFTDVKESDYYYKPILWAVENNITKGTSKKTFTPEGLCTKPHVLTFLWRANGCPAANGTSVFEEDYNNEYFKDALRWADCSGILWVDSSITFGVDEPSPRADIVTYLYLNSK